MKILPCPFCGKEPRYINRASNHTKTGWFWAISCYCGGYTATAYQIGETEEEVIRRWNARYKLPENIATRWCKYCKSIRHPDELNCLDCNSPTTEIT